MISTRAPGSEVKHSDLYQVKVGGRSVFVYDCEVAHYAILSGTDDLTVEVDVGFPFERVTIRPLSARVIPRWTERCLRFKVTAPCRLSVEFDDDMRHPLFVLINPPDRDIPERGQRGIHFFPSGMVHEVGEVRLGSGETAYIEDGAVVRGRFVASDVRGVCIRGRGILDGSTWRSRPADAKSLIRIERGVQVYIEGITLVDAASWHVVPMACSDVQIQNVSILGINGTGDGIDVVSCQRVNIADCFIRTKDDCIALKGVEPLGGTTATGNVYDVRVSGCVLWNAEWGNAVEIGYETRCAEIARVVFRDMDVIHCELEGNGSGAVFAIHNGDRAMVRDILYENVRVEDAREKLIDLKVLRSRYSRDKERGHIRDVRFRNVQVVDGPFPVSILRSYDQDHSVSDITIENLVIAGRHITSANEARMVVEGASNLRFM